MVRGAPDPFSIPLVPHRPTAERVISVPGQVHPEEGIEFSLHRPAPGSSTRGHPRTRHTSIQLKLPLGSYLSNHYDGRVFEGLNTGL